MQPSPTTALIALLATAAGSLTTWYSPSPVPGLILGALVYVGVVLGLAKTFGIKRDQALIGTSKCLLLALAVTAHAIARICITSLNALARWDTSAISRTGATAP